MKIGIPGSSWPSHSTTKPSSVAPTKSVPSTSDPAKPAVVDAERQSASRQRFAASAPKAPPPASPSSTPSWAKPARALSREGDVAGTLNQQEVREALARGETPDQILAQASGQKLTDGAAHVLQTARIATTAPGNPDAPFSAGGRQYASARDYVQFQAAEGKLTAQEAAIALRHGASPDQVEQWAAGQVISDEARLTLQSARLSGATRGDPAAPFSAGGRTYASAQEYVQFQAAEGKLTGKEVEMALRRGATPDQIEQWAAGHSLSDNARLMLQAGRAFVKSPPPTSVDAPRAELPPPAAPSTSTPPAGEPTRSLPTSPLPTAAPPPTTSPPPLTSSPPPTAAPPPPTSPPPTAAPPPTTSPPPTAAPPPPTSPPPTADPPPPTSPPPTAAPPPAPPASPSDIPGFPDDAAVSDVVQDRRGHGRDRIDGSDADAIFGFRRGRGHQD